MGLCRNAVAQKLRSGFEPGKRLGSRIVELYKMRPIALQLPLLYTEAIPDFQGAFSTRMYFSLA